MIKWLKKIALGSLVLLLTLVGLIMALRAWNDHRYDELIPEDFPAYYQDVTDKSAYPKDLPGVAVTEIQGDYLNGFRLEPEVVKYSGVVVTFGGSEGSPAYETASQLAQQGYRVLSLFFFGQPNQASTLYEVPLEHYEEIEAYIRQTMAETGDITLIGSSKGAEYAALLASHYDSIAHVVLYDPSIYVFAGLDFSKEAGSSWTQAGQPLPYLGFENMGFMDILWSLATKAPLSYLRTYALAIDQAKDLEATRIKVENSSADFLIFAGGQDQVWPSQRMAETLKHHQPKAQVHIYEEAGHAFYGHGIVPLEVGYMAMGGEFAANQAALADSEERLLAQLADWHQPVQPASVSPNAP